MQKKSAENKNFLFTSTVYTFPLIILLLTLLVFIFYHPGIRPKWDQNYRKNLFDNFLESTIKQNRINPQAYWLFRERYSPGTFELNQNAVGFFQTFKITSLQELKTTDLLYYNSPFLISTDSVTKDKNILKKIKDLNTENILLNTKTVFITESENVVNPNLKNINLWFLLPIEEMKETNGFFDYTQDELKLIEDSFWLNHSEIILYVY